MDLQIIKEVEMPLLARKRITFAASFLGQSTPSNAELLKGITAKLKVDPKLVAIRHIYQRFGTGYAKVIAHVYKTEKDLKGIEQLNKKKFVKLGMVEKKEQAPAKEVAKSGKEKSEK